MATHNMFLAMILTNAKRAEARAVLLTVDKMQPRIDMLLLDGSSQPISAPPPDILLKIIESLDKGQTEYQSSVCIRPRLKKSLSRADPTVCRRMWQSGKSITPKFSRSTKN
jgi:hypothetical protein